MNEEGEAAGVGDRVLGSKGKEMDEWAHVSSVWGS